MFDKNTNTMTVKPFWPERKTEEIYSVVIMCKALRQKNIAVNHHLSAYILRQLMVAKEREVNLHHNFVDFKSTFDTVWREALEDAQIHWYQLKNCQHTWKHVQKH